MQSGNALRLPRLRTIESRDGKHHASWLDFPSRVRLRLCLYCGHVGCCGNSKNKHATKHFGGMQHAIIRSFEPGEDWRWCYVDEIFL